MAKPKGRDDRQQMSTRMFAGAPSSVDTETSSFDVIITSETPVAAAGEDCRLKTKAVRKLVQGSSEP